MSDIKVLKISWSNYHDRMLKKLAIVLGILTITLHSFSQTAGASFPLDSLEQMLLKGMNRMRGEAGYDTLTSNDILKNASEIQAKHMAKAGKAELLGESGKYKDTGKRLIANGGSKNGEEIVLGISVSKGKEFYFVKEISGLVLKKWKESKKERPIITNGKYVLYGLTCAIDPAGKKVYISVVLSGYNITNDGAKKKKELKAPFTPKNKKFKAPATPQACKSCDKFKDYDSLRAGLYINNDGYVFLKYRDLKMLKKILKKPKDGIAVDIVQREQYAKPGYNIYDNNLFTKGILLKPISGDKLLKNNISKFQAKSKGKRAKEQTLNSKIGKFPTNVKGEYEMNLLIIQDGQVCKVITPSYVETGNQQGLPCEMLLMPDSAAYLKPQFEPKSESGLLTFKVPFEKNKSDYKTEDMKPFVEALQEPDFTIEGIYITAYSSIEGDSISNAALQKNRAKSIVEALGKSQKGKDVASNVKTSDSWILFTMEMEDGKYDYLTKMSKRKAIHEINTKPGLAEELEPALSKERFAQIVLDVVYDITGPKEERFCISKFNTAVKAGNIRQAYKIQYYIEKNIANKRFSEEALDKLVIPQDPKMSGLLLNKVVYDYFANGHTANEGHKTELKKLLALDPANNYIKYNDLFCRIKLDSLGDTKKMNDVQAEIDNMYKASDFPKRYVDDLNTEFQFKIIDVMDTVPGAELLTLNSINKIKSYYNVKEGNWQNSLKLSYAFMKHRDYKYAAGLLEPFVLNPKVPEDLLFAFISACSNVPERISSAAFANALEHAHTLNPDRYCKLFGAPNLSFQVLDIPKVKEDYLKFNCATPGQ